MGYVAFSSLVDDSVAVSRGCVLTRDWVNGFFTFLQVVLLFCHPAYPVSSLGYMCTYDHELCTFSSHGPHETASHLQFHICVSSIITRSLCGRPSKVVPSLLFGSGAGRLLTTGL